MPMTIQCIGLFRQVIFFSWNPCLVNKTIKKSCNNRNGRKMIAKYYCSDKRMSKTVWKYMQQPKNKPYIGLYAWTAFLLETCFILSLASTNIEGILFIKLISSIHYIFNDSVPFHSTKYITRPYTNISLQKI